jgi:NitT/TauT family transport system permease protein
MQTLASLILTLLEDLSFSWVRMFIALFFSVIISIAIGIFAARSKLAGRIIIPVLDIFQTLPILAFFPFAIYIVVAILPGYVGINAAVILLIITSMVWNISFAVYESISSLPKELLEVSDLYKLDRIDRLRKIFIPACMPRVVEQSILSWSIGLFYLVTSEIFSTGNANYTVKHGIGVALTQLAFSGNYTYYLIGIVLFIIFVVATRFLFFMPWEKRVTRYSAGQVQKRAQSHLVFHMKSFPNINYIHMPKLSFGKKRRTMIKRVREPSITAKKHSHIYYLIAAMLAAFFLIWIFTNYPYLWNYEVTAAVSLAASFVRVWVAFFVILLVAVPTSIYLVFMTKRSNTYLLAFQIIASIPATVLLPIIVIGLKNAPYHNELIAFVVFFLSGLWYIVFSAISNSKTLNPEMMEVKRIFGIRGFKAWKKIYINALLPGFITGGITAIAAEWNASIVAEYFTTTGISGSGVVNSVSIGIGKLLDVSLSNGNLTLMLIALINLTVMIIIINTFLWKRAYKNIANIYG